LDESSSKNTVDPAQESSWNPDEPVLVNVAETETEASTSGSILRLLREIVETILLTLVIFVVVNTLTGRFRIEGPSMLPNLEEGQYLIVDKVVYKLRAPHRGEIIVFHQPRDPNRDLIKRIIGLPGETIDIEQGLVYIDGERLREPYVAHRDTRSVQYQLGPDEFFVVGDNRPNSDDSRSWGPLQRNQIVGRAWISYWPVKDWGSIPHYSFKEE
jgi:signal peptidase I